VNSKSTDDEQLEAIKARENAYRDAEYRDLDTDAPGRPRNRYDIDGFDPDFEA
jgi:hypothetical protein